MSSLAVGSGLHGVFESYFVCSDAADASGHSRGSVVGAASSHHFGVEEVQERRARIYQKFYQSSKKA